MRISGMLAVIAICAGITGCGRSATFSYNCSAATGSSAIVQAVCSTSAQSTTTTATTTTTTTTSTSTVSTCSYSQSWVITTTTDPAVDFTDGADPLIRTVTSSTCVGVIAGTSDSLMTDSVVNTTGNFTISVGGVPQAYTSSGTTLIQSSSSQCLSGGTLETITLDTGVIQSAPTFELQLLYTYTFSTNSC